MDMSQYRGLFVSEAREHARRIGELALLLERNQADREQIDALFRAAHSIKGMAASMEFRRIADLAHHLESLMDRVRKGFPVDAGLTEILLAGADTLEAMIGDVEQGQPDGRPADDLVQRVNNHIAGSAGEPAAAPPPPVPASGTGGGPEAHPARRDEAQTVRIRTGLLDRFVNITGELVTVKHRLLAVAGELGSQRLNDTVRDLARLLRDLHDQVIAARLIPFESISGRFPRVVRDLAKQSGKEVDFTISGKEIELDRGMLEALADPLLHILRNAVDHGIESPSERREAGKPPNASISLTLRREIDHLVLTIADDGRGMDPQRLIAEGVARQIISAEQGSRLTPAEALLLVCQPGFSTSARITEVSGRGVGMDAVRVAVQALSGTLSIESVPGHGSRFILKLPLSIAIINVLLVTAGSITVAVPVTSIQRTLELRREAITSQGKQKVFYLNDEPVPLLSLNRIFGEPLVPRREGLIQVFVCEVKGQRVGMVIDRIIGQQELFVKPLGRPLSRLRGVSGGGILGGGEIVFILDVPNLL